MIDEAIATGEANFSRLRWRRISRSEYSLPLLMMYPDHIDWSYLSERKWAMPLLLRYPKRILWSRVPANSEWVYSLIKQSADHIDWSIISRYPIVLQLIPEYENRVAWEEVPSVSWALSLLLDRPYLVKWNQVCAHEWALPLMLKYPKLIVWHMVPPCKWTKPLNAFRPKSKKGPNPWDYFYGGDSERKNKQSKSRTKFNWDDFTRDRKSESQKMPEPTPNLSPEEMKLFCVIQEYLKMTISVNMSGTDFKKLGRQILLQIHPDKCRMPNIDSKGLTQRVIAHMDKYLG